MKLIQVGQLIKPPPEIDMPHARHCVLPKLIKTRSQSTTSFGKAGLIHSLTVTLTNPQEGDYSFRRGIRRANPSSVEGELITCETSPRRPL